MKKTNLIIAIFILLISFSIAKAQDTTKTDDFNFDDVPVDDQKTPYIGVGGGVLFMPNLINNEDLNKLAKDVGIPDLGSNILMSGGGGFTAVGIVPNLRLGVYAAGGVISNQSEISLSGTNYTKVLKLASSFTAVQIDYAIGFSKGFNMFPGIMLGYGKNSLSFTQTKSSGGTFNEVISDTLFSKNSNFNKINSITSSNILLIPQLNFEYNLTQFIMLRVGAGYKLLLKGDWTDDNSKIITSVPEKIGTNGLTGQIGLFLGLFQ
jgi:hypothetical protein